MLKDKVILAIDHGSRTGWCVLKNGVVTNTGFIKYTSFVQYFNEINQLFSFFKPNFLGVEEPKHLRNARITQFLIGLYTILKLCAEINRCEISEVNPKSYKKFITGSGSAEKEIVLESLLSNYKVDKWLIYKPVYYKSKTKCNNIKEVYYDESDATAIAFYVYNNYNKQV